MIDLTTDAEMDPEELVLDLAGRLRMGDRVLPVAPASLPRDGYITAPDAPRDDPGGLNWLNSPADCQWRETTLEAHERQSICRDLDCIDATVTTDAAGPRHGNGRLALCRSVR